MADYHPLIARAVAGLDKNTGEARRALYERARTALVAQLRGVQPALEESEITRERLALEEAIRKVEAEAARSAREAAKPTAFRRAEIVKREPPPAAAVPPPRPARPQPGSEALPPREAQPVPTQPPPRRMPPPEAQTPPRPQPEAAPPSEPSTPSEP